MVKKEMTPEERISMMKENLGTRFIEESKNILKDGKVLKGEEAIKNFNTELNELTFEIEQIYPLDYKQFKANFPNTVKLVQKVSGNTVIDGVNKGLVLQGWSLRTNVDEVIENIKKNIKDPEKAEEEIQLRNKVFDEITRMKEDFEIEWNQDLFWKIWKIKEGEIRMSQLIDFKGKELAKKKIQTLKDIGGIEFLKILQKEVYSEE